MVVSDNYQYVTMLAELGRIEGFGLMVGDDLGLPTNCFLRIIYCSAQFCHQDVVSYPKLKLRSL